MNDMVIAECQDCGQRYFGYSEEEVSTKFQSHKCFNKMSDAEFWAVVDKMLEG